MSTPMSPDPDDRIAAGPITPDSAAATPGYTEGSPARTSATGAAGQHAVARPYPPTTQDPAVASGTGDRLGDTRVAAVPAAVPVADTPADRLQASDDRRLAEENRLAEERRLADERDRQGRHAAELTAAEVEARRSTIPEPPRKPGLGRHLLGILLGLVLTPVALLLTGIGMARLADATSTDGAIGDVLGLTLLIIGVVLLAVIVLLGAWSPMVPITGGLVWGLALGIAFLVLPTTLGDWLGQWSADSVLPNGVQRLTDSAMSGSLLAIGAPLVAAGIAAARARRRGRRWAEGVAAVREARLEAQAADQPVR
ncbi:MAG TPA: hypothetical protein VGK35_09225 [Actinotalea sp.]